jgi:hypothetical protein
MQCTLCHNDPILNVNPNTQARKRLVIYNSSNGIVSLRKHVNSYHLNILKKNKKLIILSGKMKNNFPKRDQMFLLIPYLVFFVAKEPFKKDDVQQKQFLEDLTFLIIKNHLIL